MPAKRGSSSRGSAARTNQSSDARLDNLDRPFAQGTFRWVSKGRYTSGPREGTACVAKWFKDGGVLSSEFYSEDIKAVSKAIEIVDAFNRGGFINKAITVNQCQVWSLENGKRKGEKLLVEPYIKNFEKWNSNSGWADTSTPWNRVMQALSHFSYHISNGQFVLCDLQGGVYSDAVVITDPVVLSTRRIYGVTDLGPKGIEHFFSQHSCNEYCRSEWSAPRRQKRLMQIAKGTTMRSVPTRHSRPQDY